jgi:hypothetical protein
MIKYNAIYLYKRVVLVYILAELLMSSPLRAMSLAVMVSILLATAIWVFYLNAKDLLKLLS